MKICESCGDQMESNYDEFVCDGCLALDDDFHLDVDVKSLNEKVAQLNKDIKALVEALEFFAKRDHWCSGKNGHSEYMIEWEGILPDENEIVKPWKYAQGVLDQYNKKENENE